MGWIRGGWKSDNISCPNLNVMHQGQAYIAMQAVNIRKEMPMGTTFWVVDGQYVSAQKDPYIVWTTTQLPISGNGSIGTLSVKATTPKCQSGSSSFPSRRGYGPERLDRFARSKEETHTNVQNPRHHDFRLQQ